MAGERWIFTTAQLQNTPSRKAGIDAEKELTYRQQGGQLIQDMGQRLHVTQLCINTAIVYLHRFYMFHSFTKFHRNDLAPACLFLAAKVEEQPRKLEHVVSIAHRCLNRDEPALDTKSEKYLEKAQELVVNENILLQTLGFEITVDHPHTHVIKTCQLVRSSKDLTQTSYFLATNSLHLTTMCLQYKPTVVCCVAIHLACKWSSWEFPQSSEGHQWWWYVDKTVTEELLEQLVQEFLNIIDKCPTKLKQKILTYKGDKDSKVEHGDTHSGSSRHAPKRADPSAALGKQPGDAGTMKPPAAGSIPVHTQQQQQQQSATAAAGMRRCKSDAHLPSMQALTYKEYKERKELMKQGQLDKKVPVPELHAASRTNTDSRSRQLGTLSEVPVKDSSSRGHAQNEIGRTSHHAAPTESSSSQRASDSRGQHGDNRKRASDTTRTPEMTLKQRAIHHAPNDNQALHRPIPSDGSRSHHGTPNAHPSTSVAKSKPMHHQSAPVQNDVSNKSKAMNAEQKAAAQRHEHYKDRRATRDGSTSELAAAGEARHRHPRVDHHHHHRYRSSGETLPDATLTKVDVVERHRDSLSIKSDGKQEQNVGGGGTGSRHVVTGDSSLNKPDAITKSSKRKSPLEPDWIKEQRPDYKPEHHSSSFVSLPTASSSPPPAPSSQPPAPSQLKLTLRIPPPPPPPVELEPGEILSSSPTTPSKVPVVKLERLTESQITAHRPKEEPHQSSSHKHSRSKSDSHRKEDRHKTSSSGGHAGPTPRIEPLRLKFGSGGEVKKSEQKVEKLLIKLPAANAVGSSAAERHFTDSIKEKERRERKHHEHHSSHRSTTDSGIDNKHDDLRISSAGSDVLKLRIPKSRLQSPSGGGGGDEKPRKSSKHHSSSRKRHHSPGKAESGSHNAAKQSRRDGNSQSMFSPPQPQMNILQAVAESLESNGDKNNKNESPALIVVDTSLSSEQTSSSARHKHKKSKHHSPVAAAAAANRP
ncbi:uncharacterized protein LOC141907222 [Tubulanus polymorphus]|uniref:uncharacterized protein LOC141907222 n=1 Tax=Tubulanus polymorphus TaxID=672921 RepID=UPI003DA4CF27